MSKSLDPVQAMLKAAVFSAHKHKDQRRKDAVASPYINHPLPLANILRAEGGVEDVTVLIAALLHDTIEDTETDRRPVNFDEVFRAIRDRGHVILR